MSIEPINACSLRSPENLAHVPVVRKQVKISRSCPTACDFMSTDKRVSHFQGPLGPSCL